MTDLVAAYDQLGYVVVDDVIGPDAVASLRAEATAICRGARGAIPGVEASGEADDEQAVLGRYLCIHFPHKISPLVRDVARATSIVGVLTQIIGPNVKMMQSMLFFKAAGKPGQAWHQDEAHIPTRDRSLVGVWIALDDAAVDNGCLWVLPGSHRTGVLHPTRRHADGRFDATDEAYGFPDDERHAVPVELAAGGAVFFSGYLLHRSLPNTRASGLRRALVNHYMSAESLLPWFPPAEGEPLATLDHRDVLLVAGRDPYAARGVTDVVRPYLRPDHAADA